MKRSYSIYFITLLTVLFFSSCEKGIDLVENENTIYIPNSGLSTQTVLLGESTIELGIYKAGINQNEGDITVSLKVDLDTLTQLQASNPSYQILPEAYYSIESTSIIIAKNKESETCKIHIKGIDSSFTSKNYILPISIASISPSVNVLEESKTALLYFSRYRNVYESSYKAFGQVIPLGEEGTSTAIDEVLIATTNSENSIKIKGPEYNQYLILTVLGNEVNISSATGSESYNIKNTEGKTSTYTGDFDECYQTNKGKFVLYYTYTKYGKQMDAEVELNFWL